MLNRAARVLAGSSIIDARRSARKASAAVAGMAAMLLVLPGLVRAAEPPVEFNRDVRPILSDNCFACHGLDKSKRKADRRLDTLEGATADNDGVRAVVA